MKKCKKIIVTVIVVFLVVLIVSFATMALRVSYLMAATKGEQITEYENPKSTLLVVDVQNDTLENFKYSHTDTIMKNINDAITYAYENDIAVIYIKQEYSKNPLDSILSLGTYHANSEGSQLSSLLESKPEMIFSKHRSDAFSVIEFEEYLLEQQIDTLYLVGADASTCVYKTASGGVNRGYGVHILKDGVFAGSDDIMTAMTKKYSEDGIGVNTVESLFK